MVCLAILWSKQTITDRKNKLSPEMYLVAVVLSRLEEMGSKFIFINHLKQTKINTQENKEKKIFERSPQPTISKFKETSKGPGILHLSLRHNRGGIYFCWS